MTVIKSVFLVMIGLSVAHAQEATDFSKAIVGKWNYKETEMTMDDKSMKMKSTPLWTMEYRADGTFSEVQQVGDTKYPANSTYTLTGNKLQRKGLVEIELVRVTDTDLVFKAVSVTQYFEKIP